MESYRRWPSTKTSTSTSRPEKRGTTSSMIGFDLCRSTKLSSLSLQELEAPFENVPCSVSVSIDYETARATVNALGQSFSHDCTARRAFLRSTSRRYGHNSTPSFFRFVRQHVAQRCPARMMLVPSESFRRRVISSGLHELDDVQIFDTDRAVVSDQSACQPVELRFPCARQMLVTTRENIDRVASSTRLPYTVILRALRSAHDVFERFEWSEVSKDRTRVRGDQLRDADVESYNTIRRRQWRRLRDFAREHGVVAVGFPSNGECFRTAKLRDVFPRTPPDVADAWETRVPCSELPVHVRVRERVVSLSGFETWRRSVQTSADTSEERVVRESDTSDDVLENRRVDSAKLRALPLHLWQLVLLIDRRYALASYAVGLAARLQRGVVQFAAAFDRSLDRARLCFRGVQAKLVCAAQHDEMLEY